MGTSNVEHRLPCRSGGHPVPDIALIEHDHRTGLQPDNECPVSLFGKDLNKDFYGKPASNREL